MKKKNIDGLELLIYDDADRIFSKENNIWLGVSISMKSYSEELTRKYLQFISKYSREKSYLVIGDDVAAITMRELDGMGKTQALDEARKKGTVWVNRYKKSIDDLELENIEILRIVDLQDELYWERFNILKKEYNSNEKFKKEVQAPIIEYLISRKRTISEKRLDVLSEYILQELPSMLNPITINGEILAETFFYPTYNTKTSLAPFLHEVTSRNKYGFKEKGFDLERNAYIDCPINM